MTVDDDNSIYVGGIPYSTTEDTLRRIFDPYGAIVAVKIINDRPMRGKCYAFVTFRNPRSVIDAIDEMNGKTIDGRPVRVNGVTTRGGRAYFSREHARQNIDVGMDRDKNRDRERDYDRDRDRYWERYNDRSRERGHSWDHDQDWERGFEHAHDHIDRVNYLSGDQIRDREMADNVQERGRNSDWDLERDENSHVVWERNVNGANSVTEIVDKDTEQHSKKQNGTTSNGKHRREISSDLSDAYNHEVKGKLDRSFQRHDELKKEITQMEEKLGDKEQLVSSLQKKARKLNDALFTAKKLSSQRKEQLAKLRKCFLQVKEYNERLKIAEQEFETLVDSAITEIDAATTSV